MNFAINGSCSSLPVWLFHHGLHSKPANGPFQGTPCFSKATYLLFRIVFQDPES
jgi:hypothetical protein